MKQPETTEKHKGQRFTGVVTSTKMTNVVTVSVTHTHKHLLYKKGMKRTKKFLAATGGVPVHERDIVTIVETKPVSKNVHFVVLTTAKK